MVRVLIILAVLTSLACTGKRAVSEQELREYIIDPEKGLRKQKQKNGIDMEVIYRPAELIIAQQLSGIADSEERRRVTKSFDTLSYFVIKLSRDGEEVESRYVNDTDKFVRVINYLSSEVARNIYLINSGDTIPAIDGVYSRMFGVSTATSVMVVFDSDLRSRQGMVRFCLDDTELGLGASDFDFALSDIKKAPTLNLN